MTKLEFFEDNHSRFLHCPLTDHPFHLYLNEEELRFVNVGLYYVLKNFCFDRSDFDKKDIDLFKHQFELVSNLRLDVKRILEQVVNINENENK